MLGKLRVAFAEDIVSFLELGRRILLVFLAGCIPKQFRECRAYWMSNLGGWIQTKPFLGFCGFWPRSLGLKFQHFLSNGDGVSCSSFPAISAISRTQRKTLEEQSFSSFEIIVYHLGLVKLALEASPGGFSILSYLLHFINKMA